MTGDLASLSFVAYYLTGNEVLAIATMSKDPIASKFAELLSTGRKLTREEIDDDAWVKKICKNECYIFMIRKFILTVETFTYQ